MKDLVRFFLVLLLATYSIAQSEPACEYVYGDWSECINSFQNRTVSCVCAGVTADDENCVAFRVLPLIQDCVVEEYKNCYWKWSRWTACSAFCDGGNTTRLQQCFCDEIMTPVPDENCDANYFFGRENVPCNEFACGQTPALNKLYWISKDETTTWPIENKTFNCSQGYDDLEDSPAGKTYSQVLSDPYPASHKHYEWYFLAKEWICAELNIANGVEFSPESMAVIDKAGELLENCAGFSEEQLPIVYALKEKLGRLNNNIGGLENVDNQVSLMSSGHTTEEDPDSSLSRMTFILAIAVPLVAVVITAIALALTIYYVRDKTTVAKEEFESEDEEEPLQNTTGNDMRTDKQVPLEMEQVPTTRDESTSEEQI